jgi:hypothetical protein
MVPQHSGGNGGELRGTSARRLCNDKGVAEKIGVVPILIAKDKLHPVSAEIAKIRCKMRYCLHDNKCHGPDQKLSLDGGV